MNKYASLIEERFKEVSKAEEEANQKVLRLLDEVQKLTQENQELLQQVAVYHKGPVFSDRESFVNVVDPNN